MEPRLALNGENGDADVDTWRPWQDGPLLRKQCWTAKQLYYLTPKAVHLESRRAHIGGFPSTWIESQCERWLNEINEELDRRAEHDAGRSVDCADAVALRNRASRAKQIVELRKMTKNCNDDSADKRERLLKQRQLRKAQFQRDMWRGMRAETLEHARASAKRLYASRKKTNANLKVEEHVHDNSSPEYVVPNVLHAMDADHSPHSSPRSSTYNKLDDQSANEVDSVTTSSSTFIAVEPENSPRPKRIKHLLTSVAPTSAPVNIPPPSVSHSTIAPTSLAHSNTPFNAPRVHWHQRLHKTKKNPSEKVYQGRFLVQERKSRSRRPDINDIEAPLDTKLATRWKECAILARLTQNPQRPLILYFYACVDQKKLARKARRRWARSLAYKAIIGPGYETSFYSSLDFTLALWKPRCDDRRRVARLQRQKQRQQKRYRQMYGRYFTNYNEGGDNAPKGSLYLRMFRSFHRAVRRQAGRLARRFQRQARSSARRAYDPEGSRNTHILLIHASKISHIMDLAHLIATATGASRNLVGQANLSVGIPAVDATAQVKVSRSTNETVHLASVAASLNKNASTVSAVTVPYSELLSPAVSNSPDLQLLMREVHSIALSTSRRLQPASFAISESEEVASDGNNHKPGAIGEGCITPHRKVALAWIISRIVNCPLWLPSFTSHLFPITRLGRLIHRSAQLVMVNPEPRCYDGDQEEPIPVEGYCLDTSQSTKWTMKSTKLNTKNTEFLLVEDHYLLHMPASTATPSMLASGGNLLVKAINPYPCTEEDEKAGEKDLMSEKDQQSEEVQPIRQDRPNEESQMSGTENNLFRLSDDSTLASYKSALSTLDPKLPGITWVRNSTCLREVDFHDVIAQKEFERRCNQLANAKGLLNLLYADAVDTNNNCVDIAYAKSRTMRIRFADSATAEEWASHLKQTIQFWQSKENAKLIRVATGITDDWTITPLLQNRAIVCSGALFMKHHQFASFKACLMLLTPRYLLIFRANQSRAKSSDLDHVSPSAALHHTLYKQIDLSETYTYTGQVAAQVIVNNDTYNDPSNPGVRALPRAYEDGTISSETELERCFVVKGPKLIWAFLARSKFVRDKWAAAIKYSQSQIQMVDPLESADFENGLQL